MNLAEFHGGAFGLQANFVGEIDNLRRTLANGMRQILFVLVPAAAAILALSEPIIRLVYQRGEFGPSETVLVGTALLPGMVVMALGEPSVPVTVCACTRAVPASKAAVNSNADEVSRDADDAKPVMTSPPARPLPQH